MCLNTVAHCDEVNGDTLTIDGKKILKIWGTHQERGYAYGYLLAEEIKQVAEEYVIGFYFQNNAYYYEYCRNYFLANFEVEEKYHTETQAMVDGIQDAGINLYSSVLNRNLDKDDILFSNSLVDISALGLFKSKVKFGCSSISSWGQSTEQDPELDGQPVITRNMDWTSHSSLLENHLLIVHFPAEENEVNWISFCFPGIIGALSSINENDISALMNMGNYDSHPNPGPYHPIFLSIRNGIEIEDYDSNSEIEPEDIFQAIDDKTQLSGSIVHCVSNVEGIVIECNNEKGAVIRNETDNTVIPINNLVATNHFRKLYEPVYCYRYNNFVDSLDADSNVSIDRSWEIAGGAGGNSSTLHTIEFAPSNDLIKWSTADANSPAYLLEPTYFNTEQLFSITNFIYGDVDGDGNVFAFDAAQTLQYSAGLISNWQDWQIIAADVDGDDIITAYDAALILQYSAGIIDEFPVEGK